MSVSTWKVWIDGEPVHASALVAEGTTLVLAFVWVSLEVRHAFNADLSWRPVGAGELYAYSAAWLLFGVALRTDPTQFRELSALNNLAPGFQFAGQTSPCCSKNVSASIMRTASSMFRPRGRSLISA